MAGRITAKQVKSVACVLNGSVESAVAAYFLRSKDYPVTGISVKNIYQDDESSNQNVQYAKDVCHHLNIPHVDVTLPNEHWLSFHKALQDYFKKGLNPDVDVLFTKHILTGSLVDHCTKKLGLSSVVLPLFARADFGFDSPLTQKLQGSRLLRAVDLSLDDSFLLSQTPGKFLQRCMLPLGDLPKEAVEMLARMTSLDAIPTCSSSSTSIDVNCIPSKLKPLDRKGKLIDVVSGKTVSNYNSFHELKAGSRIKVKWQSFYVTEKNTTSGDIYVVDDPEHPAFLSDTFFMSLVNWIHKMPYTFYHEKQMMDCGFKRNKETATIVPCAITIGAMNEYCGNDHIIVSSSQPVNTVVPGEYCALYAGDECLGSAGIFKRGPSHYAMNYKKYAPKKTNGNGFLNGLFP